MHSFLGPSLRASQVSPRKANLLTPVLNRTRLDSHPEKAELACRFQVPLPADPREPWFPPQAHWKPGMASQGSIRIP